MANQTFSDDDQAFSPQIIQQQETAQIETQVATARKYPRNLAKVRGDILAMATMDEETAASCFYTLKRGDKVIAGPSVRLAEIIFYCYGNSRAGARSLGHDGKTITAQGVFFDAEKNNTFAVEIARRVTDSKGKLYNDDMIAMTGNAAASIAVRNAILRGTGALFKQAYDAARKVAIGDQKTLGERRLKVVTRFGQMGIEPEVVFAYCGKTSIEEIGLDDLEILIGLGTSIKDGDSNIDDAFADARVTASGAMRAKQIRKSAEYIAQTEKVSMDEALRLAEERFGAGKPKPDAGTNGKTDAKQPADAKPANGGATPGPTPRGKDEPPPDSQKANPEPKQPPTETAQANSEHPSNHREPSDADENFARPDPGSPLFTNQPVGDGPIPFGRRPRK